MLKPGISALPAPGFAGTSHIDHNHYVYICHSQDRWAMAKPQQECKQTRGLPCLCSIHALHHWLPGPICSADKPEQASSQLPVPNPVTWGKRKSENVLPASYPHKTSSPYTLRKAQVGGHKLTPLQQFCGIVRTSLSWSVNVHTSPGNQLRGPNQRGFLKRIWACDCIQRAGKGVFWSWASCLQSALGARR